MIEVVSITPGAIRPAPAAVLEALGVPVGREPQLAVAPVLAQAFALFDSISRPRALVRRVETGAFAEIYRGEDGNQPDTPLDRVVQEAEALALFVATLGAGVTEEVGRRTEAHDYPAAAALDAIASLAADGAVRYLERRFAAGLATAGRGGPRPAVLAYSPGYCGWHLGGQRRLLAALEPERIGVSLSPSCLMLPLKSVSGVLVAGDAGIHDVEPCYEFCRACATVACRLRVERLRSARGE